MTRKERKLTYDAVDTFDLSQLRLLLSETEEWGWNSRVRVKTKIRGGNADGALVTRITITEVDND